ncbi:unnamed protein product [Trichobilharzia regenti]|nr:unnamed protein product [Trichobilharzia regenti]
MRLDSGAYVPHGLERETVRQEHHHLRDTDYHFVSSDAEEDGDDYNINATKNVPTWIQPHLSSKYLSKPNSVRRDSTVRRYAVHIMNSLRNLTIQILAFIMVCIYAVGNIFMHIISCLPRVYRWILTKFSSSSNDVNNSSSATVSSNAEATWYPSSLGFRSTHKPNLSSFTVPDDPYAERQRNDNGNTCLHWLLPVIFILLPLLLILSMLFSPIGECSVDACLQRDVIKTCISDVSLIVIRNRTISIITVFRQSSKKT